MRSLVAALVALLALAAPAEAQYQIQNGVQISPLSSAGGTFTGPVGLKYPLNTLARLSAVAITNNPRANAVMASPPAITIAPLWTASTAYTVGQIVVNVSGSGSTSLGNWYTLTSATCTSASSGGPTGTGTGITDGTCSWNYVSQHPTQRYQSLTAANTYLWSLGAGTAGLGGVVTFTGGVPANNAATNCMGAYAATVVGTYGPGASRWEQVTDATYPVWRVFNTASNSQYRIIVNGQYVATTAVTMYQGGWGYILLDFSAVGGRAVRDIVIESESNTNFCAIDVGITEGVYKATQKNPITTIGTGDSIMAAAGADMYFDGWFYIVSDYLGASNPIDTGIGGTGYLVSSTSGTALSRISDVIAALNANPNAVIFDENGYNDISNGFTPAQIQAASLAYMQAIRSYPGCTPCATVPIIESGIWAASNNGANWANGVAAEQGKQAAVAAMNDPRIIFVPLIQATGGSILTGTGNDGTPSGTATFATNVMTVTATSSTSFDVGTIITASGVTAGTYITSLGTGAGGAGTYNLSTSPGTLASRSVTGVGQQGNGNADIYLNGSTLPHPNTIGHAFYAQQVLNNLRMQLNALGY